MQRRRVTLAAVVAALLAGCAADSPHDASSHVGKVQGLYVEQYRGIFIDRALTREADGKQLWAYVSFDQPLQDGRTVATAALQAGEHGIEPGDLVAVRLAQAGMFSADAVPDENRVVALVAKHGSDAAAAYGSTDVQRAGARPTHAKAQ
jgi:hypothetical protein